MMNESQWGLSHANGLIDGENNGEHQTPKNVLEEYPASLLHFATFCLVLFITIGVPGNLLTILALSKARKLHNATTAFIVNLSVADLLFCLFNLPLVISTFLHRGWVHGELLCTLFPFFRYSNVAVSLFSVLAITINRYVMIAHPKYYKQIYRCSTITAMILTIWSFSLGILIPTLLGQWGRFGFDPSVGTCTILRVDGKSPKAFLFATAFGLPCIVIILCYLRIFWIVRRAQRKARRLQAVRSRQVRTVTTPACLSAEASEARKEKREARDMRLIKMILVIFFSFIVSYLPVTFVKVLGKEDSLPVTNICGYILIFMTSCTNPIIYVLMSTDYRKAYRDLFVCGSHASTTAGNFSVTSKL